MKPDAAPDFLTVPQLCRRLNLSEKTVRSRIKSGEIPARKVASKRGGFAFQIPLEWVENHPEATGNRPENHVETTGISTRNRVENHVEAPGSNWNRPENNDTAPEAEETEKPAETDEEKPSLSANFGKEPTLAGHVEPPGSDRNFHPEPSGNRPEAHGNNWRTTTEARELEFLREQARNNREEIQFLRGLIEQRDRDAAELRAALREALRAMPKQLNSSPANSSGNEKTIQNEVAAIQKSEESPQSKIENGGRAEKPTHHTGFLRLFRRKIG